MPAVTDPAAAPGRPPCLPGRFLPSRSVRLRLTVLYGGLFLASGTALLAITYVLVAHGITDWFQPTSRDCAAVAAGPGGMIVRHLSCQSLISQVRHAELRQLLIQSGFALVIMTAASIGLGWLVAGRVLRPLQTITAAAQRISATNLHERLALDGPDDDLKELADTFDGLLSRLEAAFSAQRQFIANASHELRTPLARVRTLVEVALRDPDATAGSLRATCGRVLAAGEEQERLIEALLTLAWGQRGIDHRAPVDLKSVAEDILLSRQAEAGHRGLRTTATLASAYIAADPPLVERLVANLVDNALRHNAAQGWAEVTTCTRAGRALLRVANTGPRIPPGETGRLLQPFQRLDAGRTRQREGLGLGLSIVAAITDAHGATLSLSAPPAGGLIAEVSFPAMVPASGPPGIRVRA